MQLAGAILRRLHNGLNIFERGFILTTLSLVFIFVFMTVLTRYVLHISLPWLEELTRFALIATVFVGGAVATQQKEHIVVDVISPLIKRQSVQRALNLSLDFLLLAMCVYFAVLTYKYMMSVWRTPAYSPTLTFMHMGWVKSMPFVGGVLWSIELLVLIMKDIRGLTRQERQ